MRKDRRAFLDYLINTQGIMKKRLSYILDQSDAVILKEYPYVTVFAFYDDSNLVVIDISYSLYKDEESEIKERIKKSLVPTDAEYRFTDGLFHLAMKSSINFDKMYQRYVEGRLFMNEVIDWRAD